MWMRGPAYQVFTAEYSHFITLDHGMLLVPQQLLDPPKYTVSYNLEFEVELRMLVSHSILSKSILETKWLLW